MKRNALLLLLCLALLLAGCSQPADSEPPPPPPVSSAPPAPSSSSVPEPPSVPPSEPASSEPPVSSEPPPAPSQPSSHAPVEAPEGDIIYFPEKMFVALTNDVYYNTDEYLGKTLRYEGMYFCHEYEDMEPFHCVIRYGPGCCGTDAECGFETRWDGEWPQDNDWVEVTGVLEEEEYESGWKYLYLRVTAIEVLQERGAEYVYQ